MSESLPFPGLAALLQTQQTAFRAEGPVSASTRKRGVSKRATRRPTSPQPTMSTRPRRKRAGKAPKGL